MSRYIDEHRGRFGVEPICRVLDVSASAYYQRASGERSARALEDERLLAVIRETHKKNYEAYLEGAAQGGRAPPAGTYNNSVIDNSTYASTGTDLAWAQAVPDASSPIGVKTYRPLLHCNVTAYDGPGSPPAFGGNVWSGTPTR